MAKTVGDLLIKLKAEGLENVTALKSALRKLGEASVSSDKQLLELKKDILEVAKAGKSSRQSIKGQIDALKGLRDQATLGGNAFKQFSKDVAEYEAKLKAVDAQIDSTGKKLATLRQLESRFTGRTVEGVEKQIASRRQLLDTLKPLTAEYAKQLGNVNALEQGVSRALARQQVVASAQMQATVRFARGGDVTGGPGTFASALTQDLGKLPQTINALNLELSELKTDLKDLDITSDDYRETQARILELEEKLKKANDKRKKSGINQERRLKKLDETEEGRARRAAKVAGIQAALSGRRGNTLEIGSRDAGTGAIIAGGTAPVQPYVPPQVREISELYRGISDIGMAGINADIDRMGKSYQEVANDIRNATLASNGSVNSLQAQRASWAQLRAGLSPTSKAYQDVGREIEKVDRRLEKLNKRRRRPTIGGAASALGGIAAGGVFGGPEGALGAAVGGAFGGIQGVAAGAALGAQVKMLREALGATSEYAAGIEKLRISLRGVTKVQDNVALSQANFNAATKAAADVTRDFNVPQDVAIRGMTKLTAAVMGAEGSVADAEVVFKNVTAAIKATGGGAQDVESAITAMVQTFSKGKVSAEELSGQLGERLPGAVTQFAKANDMTLPELQKAFKAGSVGLNELMQFIISLGPKYRDIARGIADSAADAGARSLVAFNEMKIAVGEALQPIGAQLQDAFTEFVTDILPALVSASQAAAVAINKLLDIAAFLIANFDKLASAALVLGSAIGTAGLVKAAITAGGAMNVLKLALFDVRLAVAGLGKAIAFLMANPVVLLVAGITAAGVALYRAVTANDRFIKSLDDGNTTLEEAKEKTQDVYDKIGDLQERLDKTSNKRLIQSLRRQMRSLHDDVDDLNEAMERAIYREFGGGKGFVGPVIPGMKREDELPKPELTKFKPPTGEDGDKQKLMTQAELTLRRQIRDAQREELLVRESIAQLNLDLLMASQETEDAIKRTNMEEKARFENAQRLKKIYDDELKVQRDLQASLEDRQYKLGLITEQEYIRLQIERERRKLEEGGASDEMIEKTLAVYRQQLDPDFFTSINKELSEMRRNFQKLIDPANQVIGAANAIGDAFGNSFKQVIAGQASARQALANFFQSVASHFADMASQIIAEAIKMQAVKFISQIIASFIPTGGGGTGFGGASSNSALNSVLPSTSSLADAAASTPLNLNASGNYLSGGFKAFNQGGVVSQPTLGMVGEGGEPEYIIPQSKMRESMARYSRGVRGPGVIPDNGVATMSEGSGVGVATPIDVRFSVERINNVDYVTATEFQQGLQQAAAQGAQRGEQNTLKRLQMSGSTRRRLGM